MNERYSDLFVTINTHIKPMDDPETEEIGKILEKILLEKFYSKEGLYEALLLAEGTELKSATLTNAAVEIGDTYHQIHIHFNLTILYKGKLLLKNEQETLDGKVRDWWNKHLPWQRGCYARVDLLPSGKAKNYNLKRQGRGGETAPDFTVEPASGGDAE